MADHEPTTSSIDAPLHSVRVTHEGTRAEIVVTDSAKCMTKLKVATAYETHVETTNLAVERTYPDIKTSLFKPVEAEFVKYNPSKGRLLMPQQLAAAGIEPEVVLEVAKGFKDLPPQNQEVAAERLTQKVLDAAKVTGTDTVCKLQR